MKQFVLALVLVSQAFLAQASDLTGLSTTMRKLSSAMKVVSMQINVDKVIKDDGSAVRAAEEMLLLLVKAKSQAPSKYLDASGRLLPGTEAEMARYHDLIDQVIEADKVLIVSLRQKNFAASSNALKAILPLIKEGHTLFK